MLQFFLVMVIFYMPSLSLSNMLNLTICTIKTRASLAWAFPWLSNPYIKKPFERTANNTLPQSLHHFLFLLDHCSYTNSSNSLFLHEACAFIPVPGFLALQHTNICVDRGKFRTYFKLLLNSPKTHRGKRSRTVEYTSLPQDQENETKKNHTAALP